MTLEKVRILEVGKVQGKATRMMMRKMTCVVEIWQAVTMETEPRIEEMKRECESFDYECCI